MLNQIIEHLLKVSFANHLCLFLILDSDCLEVIDSHSFHLVKGWVMGSIYCVFSIDVTNAQECVISAIASGTRDEGDLMH